MFNSGIFPEELKCAEVVPVFKKGDHMDKVNYRPISLLSSVSKIYERLIYEQLSRYFESYFSHILCGF